MAEYLIGTSGWHYEHWRGSFYPFNNDAQAFAVRNALTLARVLGQTSPGSASVPG